MRVGCIRVMSEGRATLSVYRVVSEPHVMGGDPVVDRRTFVGTLTIGLLTAPLAAEAQEAAVRARIGVFFSGSPQPFRRTWGRTFVSALRDLGWVEGQNLVLEWRYSEDQEDRRRAIVEEFVRLKVDVIVVQSTPETVVTKRATNTIPVVMVLVGDPVGVGLVESLARPAGNITGTSLMGTETSAKRLQLLKEAVPKARRVAVLGNPSNAFVARSWGETQEAGGRLGLKLLFVEVRTRDEVAAAFAAITRERPDALVVLLDSLMAEHRHQIVEFAARNRLPATYGGPAFAEAGGLLVYTVDENELWRRAAAYVDRILKGAKPADLPIEQPTKFELVINLKTAKALRLTIPPSLLLRADQVIE
jgi:putative ABC transport system substrate-binding protein